MAKLESKILSYLGGIVYMYIVNTLACLRVFPLWMRMLYFVKVRGSVIDSTGTKPWDTPTHCQGENKRMSMSLESIWTILILGRLLLISCLRTNRNWIHMWYLRVSYSKMASHWRVATKGMMISDTSYRIAVYFVDINFRGKTFIERFSRNSSLFAVLNSWVYMFVVHA